MKYSYLNCVKCKTPVEDSFHEIDNLPWCNTCFTDRLRTKNMTNVKKAERQLGLFDETQTSLKQTIQKNEA